MGKLTFYRQAREDGGVRTAVTAADETVLHHFQPGDEPEDPVLVWVVDVRCEGARLPTDPEKARKWFLDRTPVIRKAMTQLAEKLAVGIDVNAWPLLWKAPSPPPNVKMSIFCSAKRRMDGIWISSIVTDIRDQWEEIIRTLPGPSPTS